MSSDSGAGPSSATYNVGDIAKLLQVSTRHIRRLADSGAMPRPIHLGRLIRWPKQSIDEWLAAGAPSCRTASKGRVK